MKNLYSILNGKQVVAVVGNQWGDEGKGKFVDLFSEWADIIVRGTGGSNAGHTILVGKEKKSFHLVPSGILRDGQKKLNIMGSGMAIDLELLCEELEELEKGSQSYKGLRISERAHLVLPYHKEIDRLQDKVLKIGTTGRGIGAAYADKTARIGIMVGDLRDKERFVKKLKEIKEIHSQVKINVEGIVEEQYKCYEKIKELVCDTERLLRRERKAGKKVLLEGAQGLLLSKDYGTYPYVTSCDCSRYGLAKGAGLLPEEVDLTLGIVKFPFMTRVGNGPFPTEYGGRKAEEYCGAGLEHDIFYEAKEYLGMELDLGEIRKLQKEKKKEALEEYKAEVIEGIKENRKKVLELCKADDSFLKGVGLRLGGDEYGATTKRPRRVGRVDLVALKYAMGINGYDIILTKLDCFKEVERIELGVGYKKGEEEIKIINKGMEITYGLEGVYEELSGWDEDFGDCKFYNDLPKKVLGAISYLIEETRARVRVVSTGSAREQILFNPAYC